jgi:hypothetical protein
VCTPRRFEPLVAQRSLGDLRLVEIGCRQIRVAEIGLLEVGSPQARLPGPLVTLVHNRTVAIYRVSHDDYDESIFPTGPPIGTCQDALDTACGLYLNDPIAWA